MGDRSYKDIELPNLSNSSTVTTDDPNFISVYGKNGKLASKDSSGNETLYSDAKPQRTFGFFIS